MSNGTVKRISGSGLWTGILIIAVLWSLFWGVYSLFSEQDFTALNNKMFWGLLIAAYAFFVSSIGACFVGSLGSVFGVKKYKPIERRAIFLAILLVVAGMAVIFVELGQPFRIFSWYIKSPNLASPIFGMGVNYVLYLVFIILEFIFLIKNNTRFTRFFGIFAFFFALVAHSTVGSVFGVMHSRPFWYGPYMPIDFILCAWILGFALIISVLFFMDKSKQEQEPQSLIVDMGKWLSALLGINIFFVLWKTMTGFYGGEGAKYMATIALVKGPLAVRFWGLEIFLGLIVPFLVLIIPALRKRGYIFAASLLSIIGMFVNKINMVEAGQIVPIVPFETVKGINYLKYAPSFVEISIVIGAIAFSLLFYSLVDRYYFAKVKEG